jgi:signal transduction histidine kinase
LARSEAELRHLNESLEQQVAERTAELRARNEEIATMSQQLWQTAKLATMGELAASIAHELNNPLATVTLRVESLLEDAPAGDPNRRALEVVTQEVERMATLVANLLQFSRRSHPQISTVDVREEVENTLELVHYHLRKRNVRVVKEFAPDVPRIQADRQQLRQLFLNLFTNASDAMEETKGGTLTLRVGVGECGSMGVKEYGCEGETETPTHPHTHTPTQILIEVADTGPGIAPEHLDKIMEPFFTTKPEGKGTGLGMAICKRVVQEHHGTLAVESEVGQGTTVRIALPAANGGNGRFLENEGGD